MREAAWELDSVEPRDLLPKRNGDLLFAMLQIAGRDPDGKAALPYVLIRGAASVIVPVARNLDTGESRFVMIRQQRIGSGDFSLEFPAGMVDGDEDSAVAAARELEEETGLRMESASLVRLWDTPLYSSPGLSDESILFYAATFDLDDAAYRALEGGSAGHAQEGEHITTTLKTFAEASAESTSVLPLLGFFLHRLRFGEVA
jgi:8-oxo-dGTP pyrophosphatase MutT (NUDIX family)